MIVNVSKCERAKGLGWISVVFYITIIIYMIQHQISARTAGVPAVILTKSLVNISLQKYCYTILLSDMAYI
jgi:hypothetical protein